MIFKCILPTPPITSGLYDVLTLPNRYYYIYPEYKKTYLIQLNYYNSLLTFSI